MARIIDMCHYGESYHMKIDEPERCGFPLIASPDINRDIYDIIRSQGDKKWATVEYQE